MGEAKQGPPPTKVVTRPDTLIPLTSDQTRNVIEAFASNGATYFDWKRFQELTQNFPPETPIADILALLKKTK